MTDTITTELRGKMGTLGWYGKDGNIVYTTGGEPAGEMACLVINSKAFADLCDAIDAVHANLEAENESLRRELDRVLGEQEDRDGWGPKDVDGEYIHERDKVDWRDHAGTWHENATVVAVCNDGCYVVDGTVFHVHKSDIRHHHEPTVEDVLREFALEVCGEPALTIRSGVVEEYAAKLRLAGES